MRKKVGIVVGTRPNFIKITQFEKVFNTYGDLFDFKLIHTGQHYDRNMSEVFFEQFGLRKPDVFLELKGLSPVAQIGEIIVQLGNFLNEWKPDILITPGDVNSTLAAAIAANKTDTRLAHLESGLRSFDRTMPEEINRLLTDEITDEFFVTEQSGLNHLKDEKAAGRVHFVGNTMIDTLVAFEPQIQQSPVLQEYGLEEKGFVLMTMHRPANVDTKENLDKLMRIINHASKNYKIVFPIHPRTRKSLENHGLLDEVELNKQIILTAPLDYFAFQKLTASCKFVLTDSGGIQEETTFRQVPCLTLRPNTERPITIDVGTNTLVPFEPELVESYIDQISDGTYKKGEIPPLWDGKSTERIVKILSEIL
ncbi:MAG: UDP-N-acetylglucosamine 2-epimerase (non-hydrolyzing) [Flavobacteriales bacterium]|nr:UDP-N-acetylglucosamine 2-epimerase (non-hydrolyzing) [Flavobacteriales bacterium]